MGRGAQVGLERAVLPARQATRRPPIPRGYKTLKQFTITRTFEAPRADVWRAWTDPDEVRRYVERNGMRLSGRSRREALKNIGATG